MRNYYIIILTIIALVYSAIFSLVNAQSAYGDFPYYQSFRTSVQPNEIEKISPQGGQINSATFTGNGLRLTPAQESQFGAIFIKDKQFQSVQGIRIEFEFAIYGGTGADGMSVFFFDAGIQNPVIGSVGAGIGYSYNRANNIYSTNRASGLSGAYLGIALDSYGNFKNRRWQGDARISGIPNISGSLGDRYISNVTLRGAKGGAAQLIDFPYGGMGNGYNGYPVLISQPTLGNNLGWVLNETDGTYSLINTYQGDFNLRGGDASVYRKAFIEIFPFTDNSGFFITVKIQHEQGIETVIDDYPYKKTVTYSENAYTTDGDYNRNSPAASLSKITSLDATIPEYLRIGFAASTGGLTDIHLIKELSITLPGSTEANNDNSSTIKGMPVSINVLDNDIGYTGPIIKDQVGSKDFLDAYTFRFTDESGIEVGIVDAVKTSYSDSQGLWQFSFTTQKLTFIPAIDFIGQATVRYTIKAGLNNEVPYNDDAYRSLPASVIVNVTPPKAVISNRMVTPVIIPK